MPQIQSMADNIFPNRRQEWGRAFKKTHIGGFLFSNELLCPCKEEESSALWMCGMEEIGFLTSNFYENFIFQERCWASEGEINM